jgi:hypothetical protein
LVVLPELLLVFPLKLLLVLVPLRCCTHVSL